MGLFFFHYFMWLQMHESIIPDLGRGLFLVASTGYSGNDFIP
jgi:hypothetical protein